MSLIVNIILLVCMYPLLFLLYFIQKSEGKRKSDSLFGIRYSKDWLSDTEYRQFEEEYDHAMKRYLLILAVIPLLTFFIPYFSISFTIWMLWILAAIVLTMLPYYRENRKVLALKQERCGFLETEHITYAELKGAGEIRRVRWLKFAGPLLLCICFSVFSIFCFHGKRLVPFCIVVISFSLCTLLFFLCALSTDRGKTKVISSNSDINVNYTRATKNIWKNFWIISAWLNTAFVSFILAEMLLEEYFSISLSYLILWGSIVYALAETVVGIVLFTKYQKLSSQYQKYMDLPQNEEEQNWIGGMFYYNPRDRHTIVSKKVGIGTTVNFATPAGKVSGIFTALALLSIPVLCVWIILLEFTPISLTVSGNTLVARQLKNDYVIDISTIEDLTLEDEKPTVRRTSGTGMDNLQKGTFRNSTDGTIQLFWNPQNQLYLRLVSEDVIYYLGGYDDEETREVYEILTDELLTDGK